MSKITRDIADPPGGRFVRDEKGELTGSADPLMHIQSLVTRTSAEGKTYGPAQCITPEQAIAAWTLGGAFACFAEKQTGSITPGKLADFVVLDADPTVVANDQIMNIGIQATYLGGRKVFERK